MGNILILTKRGYDPPPPPPPPLRIGKPGEFVTIQGFVITSYDFYISRLPSLLLVGRARLEIYVRIIYFFHNDNLSIERVLFL